MKSQLRRRLEGLLGSRGVIERSTSRQAYESDGLTLLHQAPELVLLPRTTQEAAQSLRWLHEAGVPVVARGAGTGLSGGATPVEGGVIVGTARMRDVLEIQPRDRYARVQAGVVNADLSRATAPHGLFYAPDPSSQAACTIGGNVAENSGGPHCFKYGSTTRHILGLVILNAAGEVLDLSHPQPDPIGYDLLGLFIGSEGGFGLTTEVTIALTPTPPVVETLLGIFPALDRACDAVSQLIEAKLEPSAIEILDRLTIEAVEASVFAAGYPPDAEAVLLMEVEGSEPEVAQTVADIQVILERNGCSEARRARDAKERKRLWAGRKGAFGAMGRIAPDLYVADVVVPRTKLRQIVQMVTETCRELDLKISNVFHAGDGNLHPNISYDRRDAEEVRRVLEAGDRIMRACVEAGGSLTGEHGVGLEKRSQMELVFSPDDLEAMDRARRALDPDRLLNPGKTLPMRACMEVRTRPLPVPPEEASR